MWSTDWHVKGPDLYPLAYIQVGTLPGTRAGVGIAIHLLITPVPFQQHLAPVLWGGQMCVFERQWGGFLGATSAELPFKEERKARSVQPPGDTGL